MFVYGWLVWFCRTFIEKHVAQFRLSIETIFLLNSQFPNTKRNETLNSECVKLFWVLPRVYTIRFSSSFFLL